MSVRSFRVEVVTERNRLWALEVELLDLFARDRRATPFQSPDWLLPWVDCFTESGELRVIIVRKEGRAVVCLPLRLVERDGQRTLVWLGEGISDYLDVLLDGFAGAGARSVALQALHRVAGEAERVILGDLPEHSPLLALPEQALLLERRPGSVCPSLRPSTDVAHFEASLPRWIVRNVQRSQARLARRGRVVWERAHPGNAVALVDAFMALHTARWRAAGSGGVLEHPSVRAFHQKAAPRLIERGNLELDVLYLSDRPVAASYVLVRSEAYLYLTGFDPALENVSLGSVLIYRAILRAIERRRGVCDFLRGQEPYKYDWGARDTPTYCLLGSIPKTSAVECHG
jgi:CelD/BcsL family acetyltransferase involved in cellulose biosynthesis